MLNIGRKRTMSSIKKKMNSKLFNELTGKLVGKFYKIRLVRLKNMWVKYQNW